MKKYLIACDKYKGSMDALQACEAVKRGLPVDAITDLCPISDGGEGFTQMMIAAGHGKMFSCETVDALGRKCTADYGLLDSAQGKIAVMEMAAASGIWRLSPDERDVMQASTFGTGLMMRKIIELHSPVKILIGIGGSATNDAGCGMAAALGVKFHTAGTDLRAVRSTVPDSSPHPCPNNLLECTRIDESEKISLPEIIAACDVENPLYGANGASVVYGPQKGASPEQVNTLDALLEKIAALTQKETAAHTPGAGAAGGLGFGLLAFAGASLQSGFSLVAEALLLEKRIAQADIVITGEGSLDSQSLAGKGPVGVAHLAKKHQKPCLAIAGKISDDVKTSHIFTHTIALLESGRSVVECMQNAEEITEKLIRDCVPNLHFPKEIGRLVKKSKQK